MLAGKEPDLRRNSQIKYSMKVTIMIVLIVKLRNNVLPLNIIGKGS